MKHRACVAAALRLNLIPKATKLMSISRRAASSLIPLTFWKDLSSVGDGLGVSLSRVVMRVHSRH